jgi:zinc protease
MQRIWKYLNCILLPVSLLAQSEDLSLSYTLHKLDNGLTIIVHEDHTTPMAVVDIWYHVGSAYEKPGRTGFAHLFEHIMFEGSENVAEGEFDNLLEAAGGSNNGSTNTDRTNYFEIIPANALDLALFLESDRMGYLLPGLTQEKLDGQREVVKNERRQRVDNQPYGLAWETLGHLLYPENHPYHWPVIGYMEDLEAATLADVKDFFRLYYAPANAVLVIAGAVDTDYALQRATYWFAEIPANPQAVVRPVGFDFNLAEKKQKVLEDKVQLPRLYLTWKTPGFFQPGDAELDVVANILGGGKTSRLYRKLVYEMQIAQDVSVFQSSARLNSEFIIIATAKPGHTLAELQAVIDTEIARLQNEAPDVRDLERVLNQLEVAFYSGLQSLLNKAEALNRYYYFTGNPDYANEDMMRYRALSPMDIRNAARRWLQPESRVEVHVGPEKISQAGGEK